MSEIASGLGGAQGAFGNLLNQNPDIVKGALVGGITGGPAGAIAGLLPALLSSRDTGRDRKKNGLVEPEINQLISAGPLGEFPRAPVASQLSQLGQPGLSAISQLTDQQLNQIRAILQSRQR